MKTNTFLFLALSLSASVYNSSFAETTLNDGKVTYQGERADNSTSLKIGNFLDSGDSVIIYVDTTGKHGLAVSTSDEVNTTWDKAKVMCASKGLNWSLPSRTQLTLLWNNRYAIDKESENGTFQNRYYWSSNDVRGGNYAWVQNFYKGNQDTLGKNMIQHVRCVRKF